MEVAHQFLHTDYFFPYWEVDSLFLGTFNPACGEPLDYYYRRQANGFWKIIKHCFDEANEYPINTFDELMNFMVHKTFGCVDVIKKVRFPENRANHICGAGYEDSHLFTVKGFEREYSFEEIKTFAIENNVSKIYTTWGKRDKPVEFRDKVDDFKEFCNRNEICYTPLPSPTGRHYKGVKIPVINEEWRQRILGDYCNELL